MSLNLCGKCSWKNSEICPGSRSCESYLCHPRNLSGSKTSDSSERRAIIATVEQMRRSVGIFEDELKNEATEPRYLLNLVWVWKISRWAWTKIRGKLCR